ncbi:MAG: hypothetical protein JOZ96_21295 [Acidobacteria bacterium]|nr:hypothetical protein [Acidobacteriota bacterium]
MTTARLMVIDGSLDETGAYAERAYEADCDEVCLLLEKLKATKDFLHVQSQSLCLDFSGLGDASFEAEVYDLRDGFWAISEVSTAAARGVIEVAAADGKFGELVPTTAEEWGAFGGGRVA